MKVKFKAKTCYVFFSNKEIYVMKDRFDHLRIYNCFINGVFAQAAIAVHDIYQK